MTAAETIAVGTTAVEPDAVSRDARTGAALRRFPATTSDEVDRIVIAAAAAADALDRFGRRGRAGMLRAMGAALDQHADAIIRSADLETGLGEPRLAAELDRTRVQLEHFADVLDEGAYLEASVSPARRTALGRQPDLRRMLVPIGPVAVFAASNFPLAFSVPGGDTASALAAGNPVVVKAHESHPATSELCWRILVDAAELAGAPRDVLGLVHGRSAGIELVAHPAIAAAAFTGSPQGGRALMRVIEQRDEPIPFFGELGSINPFFVTSGAARDDGAAIAAGLVASITGSAGQLCTKPGLVIVPTGADGDALVDELAAGIAAVAPQVLLNERILDDHRAGLRALETIPGGALHRGREADGPGDRAATAAVLELGRGELDRRALEERFGPSAVVVRHDGAAELEAIIDVLPGSLTATFHGPAAEVAPIAARMRAKAGRLVFDGYPTGVSISMSQHHGGPWPSSVGGHTSVGGTAIRRFLRPVAWQDADQSLLPIELRDPTATPGGPS